MNKLLSFSTERLLLKPSSKDDAGFFVQLLNSPKWLKYIGDRKVYWEKEAEAYIARKITPQFGRLGFGNYTVLLKERKVKIGTCGLYDRDGLEGIDFGFAFLPEFEKHGYATESCKRLLKAAKEEFNLDKLKAITIEANLDSQNLLRKLGFSFKKKFRMEGDSEELWLYLKDL